MNFCITYLDPSRLPTSILGAQPRFHICTETGVLLFNSQAKAAKWIVKFGMDHIEYSVDPYHDLKSMIDITPTEDVRPHLRKEYK